MKLLKSPVESCKRNFQDIRFLTKLVAVLLNIAIILLWKMPEDGRTGMSSISQTCLWAHTVPAYLIVLGGLVIIYLMGEQPGRRFHRLFLGSGVILFTATGIVSLVNEMSTDPMNGFTVTLGGLCLLVAIVLFVDELMNEGVFKCCNKKQSSAVSRK